MVIEKVIRLFERIDEVLDTYNKKKTANGL